MSYNLVFETKIKKLDKTSILVIDRISRSLKVHGVINKLSEDNHAITMKVSKDTKEEVKSTLYNFYGALIHEGRKLDGDIKCARSFASKIHNRELYNTCRVLSKFAQAIKDVIDNGDWEESTPYRFIVYVD